MKKLATVLSLVFAATTAHASSNLQLVPQDTSVESGICVFAAQNGYNNAVAQARKLGVSNFDIANLSCNGTDMKTFAKSFKVKVSDANTKPVVFVPVNQTTETQLCVKALKEGLRSVGHRIHSLKCNGESVARFVKAANNS